MIACSVLLGPVQCPDALGIRPWWLCVPQVLYMARLRTLLVLAVHVPIWSVELIIPLPGVGIGFYF